ncbi:MAG: potassium channel family protein [Thermodesulfobacteriota bacterium]
MSSPGFSFLRKDGRRRSRKIAVLGISNYGFYLSQRLAEMGCEVLVVDKDPQRVRQLQENVEKAVIADVTDLQTLESLQLKEYDVVVLSIGDEMSASLLALLHLVDLGVKQIIAKAVSPEHARILIRIGATEVIFPEKDMAMRTANVLSGSNVLDYLPLGEEYGIVELAPDKSFIGKSLRQLDLRSRHHVEVIAVKQILEGKALVPEPDFVIRDSDLLVVVGKNEAIERLRKA